MMMKMVFKKVKHPFYLGHTEEKGGIPKKEDVENEDSKAYRNYSRWEPALG